MAGGFGNQAQDQEVQLHADLLAQVLRLRGALLRARAASAHTRREPACTPRGSARDELIDIFSEEKERES